MRWGCAAVGECRFCGVRMTSAEFDAHSCPGLVEGRLFQQQHSDRPAAAMSAFAREWESRGLQGIVDEVSR